MLLNKPVPKRLFKYKSILGDGRSHLIDILQNNRLYFQLPSELNDPFELRPRVDIDIHSDQFRDEYLEALSIYFRRTQPSLKEVERLHLAQDNYRQLSSNNDFKQKIDETFRLNAVTCLSTNENSLLMWAHYCVGHKGCLLEFDTDLWNESEIRTAFEVRYLRERPIAPVWRWIREHLKTGRDSSELEKEEIGRAAVICKSDDWAYEGEWRLFRKGAGYGEFNPKSLKRVIFGVGVDAQTMRELAEVIRARGDNIMIQRAEMDHNAYKLNYMPYIGS